MKDKIAALFKLSNLSGLQIFQLLRYATFIVVGVGFAKMGVEPSTMGHFETFIMLSGMVSFFWVSGIINSMLAIYPKQTGAGKKELLFNTFFTLAIFSCIAGLVLILFSQNILAFVNKDKTPELVKLSVLYLLLNNPSFINEYLFFLNGRKKSIIQYGVASTVATLIAALTPVALGYPITYSIMGVIAVAGARLLYSMLLLQRYGTFKINRRLQLENLKLSLPLMLSIFVSGSAEYIDGLIVKYKFPDFAFAVYRYGAKELPVLLIIANTLSSAMIPNVANDLEKGLAEIKRQSTRLMHLFFPLSIVLMLCSRFLYVYVFNSNFTYSALIFNIYLLLIIPRVMFPQTVLTGIRHTRYQLLSAVIEIALNAGLSIYLSSPERLGLAGIAVGTFVAYLFDKLFLLAINRFVFNIPARRYIAIGPLLAYSVLTVVSFIAGYLLLTF